MERMIVKGVAKDSDVARISICNIEDKPGMAFKVFSLLASKKINVDIILQSIGRDGKKDISFTVNEDNLDKAVALLEENKERLSFEELKTSNEVCKISIVGSGMVNNPGVACTMFEALYDANINIHMISTSEIKVSVLINKKNADKAMNVIHDKFNLAE